MLGWKVITEVAMNKIGIALLAMVGLTACGVGHTAVQCSAR